MTLPNRNDVMSFDFGWRGQPAIEVLSRGTDADPEFGWRGEPFWPAPSASPVVQLRATGRVAVRSKSTPSGVAISVAITARGRIAARSRAETTRFYTTWNSADTFGSPDLTPTRITTVGSPSVARAKDGLSSGKYYIEFGPINLVNTSISGFGFVTAGQSLLTWGSSLAANGFGVFQGQAVIVNGSRIGSSFGLFNGHRVAFAVDLTAKLFWVRYVDIADAWRGPAAGSADPETGTNGFDFSAISSAIYPVVTNQANAGSVLDAYFGDEPMMSPPPAGFKAGWPRSDTPVFMLASGRAAARSRSTLALTGAVPLTARGRATARSLSTLIAFSNVTAMTTRGRAAVRSRSVLAAVDFTKPMTTRGRMAARSLSDLSMSSAQVRKPVIIVVNS